MMSEKRFKIDTTSEIGHIYINNQDGEHMSWIEVENTLNDQQASITKQEQSIKILKQEIADAQVTLEMLSEKLRGWNDE